MDSLSQRQMQDQAFKGRHKTVHRPLDGSHLCARFVIALGKVLYNLFSARLWIAIAVVIVVTNLLKILLLHVGLVIGDVAEFINEIVAVVFEVVNAVPNEA